MKYAYTKVISKLLFNNLLERVRLLNVFKY